MKFKDLSIGSKFIWKKDKQIPKRIWIKQTCQRGKLYSDNDIDYIISREDDNEFELIEEVI